MKLVADLRLSAVVAAAVAFAIIAVAHLWFSASFWLLNDSDSWTIYPPLSALPQAHPYQRPDPLGYLVYFGTLMGALVAGGLSMSCLLVSGVLRRRQRGGIYEPKLPLWLPLILLLPLTIHVMGWGYHAYKAAQREALMLQEPAAFEANDI
jgi:heme/copper-type cytochrome/quinol oxidase subunit 1